MQSEIEVGLEAHPAGGRELVGKAVVDMVAAEKIKLDKKKLTSLIKAAPFASLWPAMKVFKKAVPDGQSATMGFDQSSE
jgi:hypothetical protein